VRCEIYVTALSQGWTRHPHTRLLESDSGKITIQGWAERSEAQREGVGLPRAKPDSAQPAALRAKSRHGCRTGECVGV